MRNRLAGVALFTALFSTSSSASYQYYASSPLESYNDDAPNWDINNSSNASENQNTGLTVISAAGASYIARSGPPDATNQYEVAMTLALVNSGGNYVLYLEASSNALLGSSSSGTFYAFAVQNPTLANGGCSASATLYRVVTGSVTQISSVSVPCANGIVYHAAAGNDGALHFWANNVEYIQYTDAQPLTGRPGVGGYGMPSGNGVSRIQLGPCDRTAPGAVALNSVQNYALSIEVDLQTGGSADDANGVGINAYRWYRDGVAVASTRAPAWSDVGVSAGTSHSYSVQAQDHHGNVSSLSTFPITVPPPWLSMPVRSGSGPPVLIGVQAANRSTCAPAT